MALHRVQRSAVFKTNCHTATLSINTSDVLWHSRYNKEKQYISPKNCSIPSDIHGITPQKNGIYIGNAVAAPNLGKTECFRDGSYNDLLLHSRRWTLNHGLSRHAPVRQKERITKRSFSVHKFLVNSCSGHVSLASFLAVWLKESYML